MNQFNRQYDIINPELLNKRILVIGAGGIGSWTVLALAKMGCKDITVMDFDTVSVQNLNAQIYRPADVGRTKCEALADIISDMVTDPNDPHDGYLINTIEKRWEPGMEINYEIVISALDDMEVRRDLWNDIKKNPFVLYYIDGRMGGEFFRAYTIDLMKADLALYAKYEKTISPPERVDPTPCTEKAVVYNVFCIGGIICSLVKKICKEETPPYEFAFDLQNLNRI